ncbi:cytochrome c, partial [bacterium]|nr:cytochrome c [bacterium]
MKRAAAIIAVFGAIAAALFFYLTAPARLAEAALVDHAPNLENGARMFRIGGCASCHAAKGSEGEARLLLGGGLRLATPFGTFVAPNISPGPGGIGGWSLADFTNAMTLGVSPEGQHYYPAFPYTSYARMALTDLADLKGYLDTLPVVGRPNEAHEVGFPFNIRRGLGLWKLLYLDAEPVVGDAEMSAEAQLGGYLVEGPGHCAECHTPRSPLGGLDVGRWMAGAPNPEGEGKIPNLTPHENGLKSWSEEEIAYYLETGFRPDFDTAGGAMVDVVRNTSQLAARDRA